MYQWVKFQWWRFWLKKEEKSLAYSPLYSETDGERLKFVRRNDDPKEAYVTRNLGHLSTWLFGKELLVCAHGFFFPCLFRAMCRTTLAWVVGFARKKAHSSYLGLRHGEKKHGPKRNNNNNNNKNKNKNNKN